jgi:DNA-binding NarL/FixJ family response regulator
VASGNGLLSPAMTRKLIDRFATTPEPTRPGRVLPVNVTEREREVLVAVSQGLTNPEIAAALHMSVATTKTHVSRLLAKIGARERAQLVIAAYETGLVSPGGP